MVVWTEKDEITLSDNSRITLNIFAEYRQKVLLKDHPNDNTQLITSKISDHSGQSRILEIKSMLFHLMYSSSVRVGLAFTGETCLKATSCGIVKNDFGIATVAEIIAHENDTVDCKCSPDSACIMNKISYEYIPHTHWSNCSTTQLNSHRDKLDCLRNVPKQLFGSQICGNGFVGISKECDCGLRSE